MIRIGNYNPHAYYETSHISTPAKSYANEIRKREVPANGMRKVSAVYVGDKHVYPELFRYTLKYRMRLDFSFHGVSHGNYRPSSTYCEATTTGYIEDIVRLDTVLPTYISLHPAFIERAILPASVGTDRAAPVQRHRIPHHSGLRTVRGDSRHWRVQLWLIVVIWDWNIRKVRRQTYLDGVKGRMAVHHAEDRPFHDDPSSAEKLGV